MKKICFVTTVYSTYRAFLKELSVYLHNTGEYDISLICKQEDDTNADLPEFVHYFPVKMERGINLSAFRSIKEIYNILKREKFDMVQYSTPNASFYTAIASKLRKVPVRLYCQWGLAFEGFSGIKRKIFMLMEKMVCRFSTWVEPDSNGNLDYCRKLGFYDKTKSSVVLHGSAKGVSLSKFDISKKDIYRDEMRNTYCVPSDAFLFGFVGSITGDKGINELLKATQSVVQDFDDVHLILAGRFEKENSLNFDLMEWAKKDKHIHLIGLTKEPEKVYPAMDCYVTASYREGFGTTVIEAGAMGLPVITTNIPGPTDAVKNEINGLLVPAKDTESLRNAMIKMYSDRELCKKYGEQNYQIVVEQYEQSKVFHAIFKDRERLLNE